MNIRPDSPALEAGLRQGDVIQEINKKPILHVSQFQQAIHQSGKEPLLLLVNRSGNTIFIAVEAK